ncbi:MAG: hypothetical protein E5W82_10650 [Mesorhizobium sp.]|nr:MAG: hypothetical protein E5W82_10650 [Mesorhizobium sp.]
MVNHRYFPPEGWNNILSAPRDGTPIEIQNNWGVAPWFGVFKWVAGNGWRDVCDARSGCIDGPHLSWRPYAGRVEEYVDPTNGAMKTHEYWLRACGVGIVGSTPLSEPAPVPKGEPRLSWLLSMFRWRRK